MGAVALGALVTVAAGASNAGAAGPVSASGSTVPAQAAVVADPAAATALQENPRHDGRASSMPVSPTATRQWRKPLGGPVSYAVVSGNRAFVTVGRPKGTVVLALSVTTGATLWGPVPLPAGTFQFAALTFDAGRLFVVSYDGTMQALDPATGDRLWSRKLPGQYVFASAPTAANGLVYTSAAGSGGTVYAVDEKTGALVWTQEVANGDDSSPAVGGGGVYVSYVCEFTYRFVASTGAPVWSRNNGCNGGGGRTPVLNGSRLWVRDAPAGGATPLVLDTTDGSTVRPFDSDTPPAFSGSTALLLQNGTLTAVSAATGATMWSQTGDGGLDTPPVTANGIAYVGSRTGKVFGFDVASGRQVWSGAAGTSVNPLGEDQSGIPAAMTIGDGVLLVPNTTGLTAFYGKA